MKRLSLFVSCLVLAPTLTACGQEQAPAAQASPVFTQDSYTAVGSIAPLFETVKGYIIASAEQMPEGNYGYRPTPEVRTFGQIVGHAEVDQPSLLTPGDHLDAPSH